MNRIMKERMKPLLWVT